MSKPARKRGCPRTGKTRFRTDGDAQAALARTRKRRAFVDMIASGERDAGPEACRVYQCPFCQGWHLTSRPARDAA